MAAVPTEPVEELPDVSIIIVNWNTRNLLQVCLESVFREAGQLSLDVCVVDNGSSDGSCEMIEERFPQVRVIRNPDNVGFAVANNQALDSVCSKYVLLLNSDTKLKPKALEVLRVFLEDHPRAAAVAPLILHPESRYRVLSCGNQPTLRTLFNHYFFLSSLFPHQPAFRGLHLFAGVHSDRIRAVEWLSGACLFIRKAAIDQVGKLDESWFMYAEDLEWCDRFTAAGWELFHVPTAEVIHLVGASSGGTAPSTAITSLRTYFIRREAPSHRQLLEFDVIVTVGLALRALVYSLRALVDRARRDLWHREAVSFFSHARIPLSQRRALSAARRV